MPWRQFQGRNWKWKVHFYSKQLCILSRAAYQGCDLEQVSRTNLTKNQHQGATESHGGLWASAAQDDSNIHSACKLLSILLTTKHLSSTIPLNHWEIECTGILAFTQKLYQPLMKLYAGMKMETDYKVCFARLTINFITNLKTMHEHPWWRTGNKSVAQEWSLTFSQTRSMAAELPDLCIRS